MENEKILKKLKRDISPPKNTATKKDPHGRHRILNSKNNRTLIHNARFIITTGKDGHTKINENYSIAIEKGVISKIEKASDFKEKDFGYVYDAGKRGGIILTPGIINAHAHPPMYLMRSIMSLEEGEGVDETIAAMPLWERAMSQEDYTVSAIGDITEEQKHGITLTVSHYGVFWPIEHASILTGQRVINALSAVSNTHPENSPEMVEKIISNKTKYFSKPAIALHYLYKTKPDVLKKIKNLSEKYNLMFTCHLAESEQVAKKCVKEHGKREIALLEEYGLLNEKTIISHAIYLNWNEIKKLVKNRVGIAHLPTSNEIHKSGKFLFWKFDEAGGFNRICLGTDGVVSKNRLDIISEAYQTRVSHLYERTVKFSSLFKIMTSNAGQVVGEKTGKLLPGYKADIAFWKLKDRGAIPYDENNPITLLANLITHGGRFVRDLMIDGKFIIKDRKHILVDESKLLSKLQEAHMSMRNRLKNKL